MDNIQLKNNWDETTQMFDNWFKRKKTGRPIMRVDVFRDEGDVPFEKLPETPYDSVDEIFLDTDKNFARMMNRYFYVRPEAESFPDFSMNLGAGSMALYLGTEPEFAPETLWFKHFIEDYDKVLPLKFDTNNFWWKKHLELIKRQLELVSGTDIMVCIPDIVENIDILSAMRDPQACCFDLYDYPDQVHTALQNISDIYMTYYDAIHGMVERDGVSAYTAFGILGTGKTAKIQCDFAALMSPGQFDEFIMPSLKRQCDELDGTVFHLDGPECLVHVDSLMKLENLGALQWTTGERNSPAGSEEWYGLYKKVKEADKGLLLGLWAYQPEEAIAMADKLVKKFGAKGFYFQFPDMTRKQYDALLIKAEKEWID